MTSYLWVIFTVLGAVGQTARNAMQREGDRYAVTFAILRTSSA